MPDSEQQYPDNRDVGRFVVEVFNVNGRGWAKVRGVIGGPYSLRAHAEGVANAREALPRRWSSTAGMPHRVREVSK